MMFLTAAVLSMNALATPARHNSLSGRKCTVVQKVGAKIAIARFATIGWCLTIGDPEFVNSLKDVLDKENHIVKKINKNWENYEKYWPD